MCSWTGGWIPSPARTTLNDLYSAFAFSPRTWLTAESQTRYDLDDGNFNMRFTS